MSRSRRDRFAGVEAVPAISVAFLMLAFLLLTATLEEGPPSRIDLPESLLGRAASPAPTLSIGIDGSVAFGGLAGEEALRRAAEQPEGLRVLADRESSGVRLAEILVRLREMGAGPVSLGVERP